MVNYYVWFFDKRNDWRNACFRFFCCIGCCCQTLAWMEDSGDVFGSYWFDWLGWHELVIMSIFSHFLTVSVCCSPQSLELHTNGNSQKIFRVRRMKWIIGFFFSVCCVCSLYGMERAVRGVLCLLRLTCATTSNHIMKSSLSVDHEWPMSTTNAMRNTSIFTLFLAH